MSTVTHHRRGPRGGVLFTPETAPWGRVPAPRAAVGRVRVGPAGRRVHEIEALYGDAWRHAVWPAAFWQVLAHADGQGVDLVTREALRRLPARTYRSGREVAAALAELPASFARRDRPPTPDAHAREGMIHPCESPPC